MGKMQTYQVSWLLKTAKVAMSEEDADKLRLKGVRVELIDDRSPRKESNPLLQPVRRALGSPSSDAGTS